MQKKKWTDVKTNFETDSHTAISSYINVAKKKEKVASFLVLSDH